MGRALRLDARGLSPGQAGPADRQSRESDAPEAGRVTGNRPDTVSGAGWEMLFVAIDDHARIAFTAMHPDERTPQAV